MRIRTAPFYQRISLSVNHRKLTRPCYDIIAYKSINNFFIFFPYKKPHAKKGIGLPIESDILIGTIKPS